MGRVWLYSVSTITAFPALWSRLVLLTNSTSMQSIFYIVKPPEYPPALPIPGRLADRQVEGHIRPDAHSILSRELHDSFATLCRFWAIASEAMTLYHHSDGPEVVPPAFAMSMYYKLLALADSVSPSIRSGEDNLPQTTAF